ncbi:MAG: histidinol dehydrogenase [Pseudomonadota bacterium]
MSEAVVSFIDLSRVARQEREALMTRTESDLSDFVAKVRPIIEQVRTEGDQALARFAREFDQAPVEADALKCTEDDFDRAFVGFDPKVLEAIEFAAGNIRVFHERQMPESMRMTEVRPGVFAGERYVPIPSAACYVPRGKGSFPSVLLMTVVPAVVAKTPKIIILTPPGPDGRVDAATLVAARLAGATEVFKCGGAQAVAAAAYGTATIPRVDKIVGPGSPWVAAAKRLLTGVIDPGPPAGPSESIVLADETADGRLAALDLIIESEHGPDSSAFLVTCSPQVAEAARRAIPEYWALLGETRRSFSQAVLGGAKGGVVLAPSMDEAIAFVNDYAPEHLMIHSREPFRHLGRIVNAGEVLLGENTPISLGNYVLGPNAVLPTSGAARTYSPLSVFDFLKMISFGYVTSSAYPELARHTHALAVYEGFDGHALAVSDLREKIRPGC